MQTRSTDWKESTAHRIQEKEKQPGLSTDRRTGKRLSEQKGHHWGVAVPHSMWSSARGGLTQGGPRPSAKGNNSQGSLNTVTEEAVKGLIGNENSATDRAAAIPPSESLWSRPPTLRTGPSGRRRPLRCGHPRRKTGVPWACPAHSARPVESYVQREDQSNSCTFHSHRPSKTLILLFLMSLWPQSLWLLRKSLLVMTCDL